MTTAFASSFDAGRDQGCGLDALLHPAQTFSHPREVLNHPSLSFDEKRAILASWASDACAVEAAPAFRQPPTGSLVRFDDVMDALRALDMAQTALRPNATVMRQRPVARDPDADTSAPL